MHWTIQTAALWLVFGFVMTLMVTLHYKRGPALRKGWLPFPTSRGDRLFLSTVSMVIIGLTWLKLFDFSIEYGEWIALIISLIVGAIIMKYA